jgi:hypothetical protein
VDWIHLVLDRDKEYLLTETSNWRRKYSCTVRCCSVLTGWNIGYYVIRNKDNISIR